MIKWLWLGLGSAVVVSLLIVVLLDLRINPRITKVINPSLFKNSENLGFNVYRRLYQEFNENQIVILGSSPFLANYQAIWSGLLAGTTKYDKTFDVLIEHSDLNPIVGFDGERWTGQWETSDILRIIRKAKSVGKRILIHTTNNQSTNLIANNLRMELEREHGVQPWSISQTMFFTSPAELKRLQPTCGSNSPMSELSCKSELTSRKYFRKKFPTNKLISLVEKYGEKDYLLFVHMAR